MVSSRQLKHIVRVLVWGIIGIHIGLVVLLNIPSVQNKLASIVSSELGKLLKTEVSVGHIELGLFNRLHIEDVQLKDLQGDELLNVQRLSARFEIKPLLDGKIVINSVQLIGFDIRLKKDTPESIPNFQFVLDAFASKDTLNKSPNLDLRINSVLINRGQLSYDVLSESETPDKLNASHLSIRNLSASISLKAFRNDTVHAIIRRLGFEEQSGFQLEKLSAKLVADNKRLNLSDFNIKLASSTLTLDSVEVCYDSLQNLPRLTDDIQFRGMLNGNFVLKDLAPIIPVMKGLHRPLQFDLKFHGQGKNLEIPLLSLSDNRNLDIKGNASVMDWGAKQSLFLQTQLTNLSVTKSGMNYYMNALTGSVPSILQQMEYIQFKGDAAGYLNDLRVAGMLRTGVGSLNANLLINSDENNNRTYSGGLMSKDIHLGKLLNNAKFGHTRFNVEIEGFNYQNKYPESYIKGIISSLDYSDYRYENITLDGIYKDGGFNGHLALDDENGAVQIDGKFNFAQRVSDFNLQASVKNFRPNALNLSDKYVDSDISLNLTADFTGSSIDDVNGRILLDSLVMNTAGKQSYFLDNLSVTAGQLDGQKEIQVLSPFLSAVVRGDYSYETIPASIMQIVQKYIPSLVSWKQNKKALTNNFRFDVQMNDASFFKELFSVPLEVHMPLSLKGYVNDVNGQLRMDGFFPSLTYNGTLYDSATLLLENPAGHFDCQLRGGMLMKSGAMLTMSVDAEAEQDHLKTIISWGNNTDVTYGGRFAAVTRFFKTEGKSPILQADIDILPTEVVLNDTIWNIRSSHVAIDSGRVYIDNFLFERPGQHLRVDGKITKEATDSCIID